MTSSAVLDLAQRLQELEGCAKLLRSEVANLEATQRNLVISESTQNRAIEIRRQAAEDDEADGSVGSSRRGRRSGKAVPPHARQLPLPQDFIDELTRKAGGVQMLIDKRRALQGERADLEAILARVEAEADAAEQKYYSVAELAGMDEDGKSTMMVGLRKKNDFAAARNELLGLYREREVLQKAMQVQTDELARQAAIIEDTANAEEQKTEAVAVLGEKSAKLEELRRQADQLERVLHAKEGILEKKPQGPTKEEVIRCANYDRRVALHELEREGEQLKRNDAAVRTRAMQIAKAEKRIEMIGDAVAGDGLSEEDRVDVELMDELITETNSLYNHHQEASIRMEGLDAKVERIDYRIGAISQAIGGMARERERIEREHEKYLRKLQQEYNREQTLNAQDIHRAEQEVDRMRQKKAKAGKNGVKRSKAVKA